MAEEEKAIIAELKSEGILCHISPQDLETLKYYGTFGEYGPGEIIIQEGVEQDRLYIVIAGELEVIIQQGGEEVVLGTISTGDCIGEISILEPGAATATVRVKQTSILWHLDVTSLQSYFEQLPVAGGQFLLGVARLLGKRLRQADQAIVENKLLPHHLKVRSGRVMQPITFDNLSGEEERPGLLGILKSKKSKISTDIKI